MMSNSGKDGRSNDLERPPHPESWFCRRTVSMISSSYSVPLCLRVLWKVFSIVGLYASAKWFSENWIVTADLPGQIDCTQSKMIRRDQEQFHRQQSGTAYRHEEGGPLLIHHHRHLRVEVQPSAEMKRGSSSTTR
jgi:hypothetical protein